MTFAETDKTPWLAVEAECLTCGFKWVAVCPLGCGDLECKECGSTDTVRGISDES